MDISALSEKRFQALIQNSADALIMLDENGMIIYQNNAAEKINGFAIEEIQGMSAAEMVHPNDLERLLFGFELSSKEPNTTHISIHRRIHKTKGWIYVECGITNMLQDDSVKAIVCSYRDVTEIKKAEEKIINSKRLYSFISQVNHLIIKSKEEKSLFEEICRIAIDNGKFKAAWIGTIDIENSEINLLSSYGFEKEDISLFQNIGYSKNGYTDSIVKTGKHYVFNDVQNSDFSENWINFSIKKGIGSYIMFPLFKSHEVVGTFNLCAEEKNFFNNEEIHLLNELAGNLSFALDNFQLEYRRKLANERSLYNEQRLNRAQSIAHIGSWELSFETNIATWSAEACRIFGLDPRENKQINNFWQEFVHPDDREDVKKVMDASCTNNSDTSFNYRIIRKDGNVRYLYTHTKFEYDETGNIKGLSGVVQDETDRKLIEIERDKVINEIIRHNNNLEQFTYIISHNLRAPVANILGLTTALQDKNIEEDIKDEFLNKLLFSTERLDQVIKDLNIILHATDEVNETRININVQDLTKEVCEGIQDLIEKENVSINTEFEIIEISSVRSYLYSIFYNLISNSIKYKKNEVNPVITIKNRKIGNKIEFTFRDNGLGISPSDKKELFGLYKRFHQHVDGKGLGLFMTKTQIENLGGKIHVNDNVNDGLEFIIQFETE